jgi:hypothetical protein
MLGRKLLLYQCLKGDNKRVVEILALRLFQQCKQTLANVTSTS